MKKLFIFLSLFLFACSSVPNNQSSIGENFRTGERVYRDENGELRLQSIASPPSSDNQRCKRLYDKIEDAEDRLEDAYNDLEDAEDDLIEAKNNGDTSQTTTHFTPSFSSAYCTSV